MSTRTEPPTVEAADQPATGSVPAWASAALVAGIVLLQLAWVFSLPPARGADEFDHVYRAASVAHGQLHAYDEPVAQGRGDYLRVPADVVEAAGPVCASYAYTGPDNCRPAARVDGDFVKVASGSARYHPAYYAVVGTLAKPWSGVEFIYAARLATVAVCAGLWALAVLAARRAQRPRRVHLALAVVAVPVLVHSGSIVAPNGVEMVAAVVLWTALLALGAPQSRRGEQLLLALVALAGCVLATLRTMGPFWVVLAVGTVVLLPGLSRRLAVVRRQPGLSSAVAGSVFLSLLLSVWWITSSDTNAINETLPYDLPDPWLEALGLVPLWVLQSVAAFPTRNEPAPAVVYASVLVAIMLAFAALGALKDRRWWLTLVLMTVIWVVPPFVLEGLSYARTGGLWQGRYSLPYLVGLPLVLLAWHTPRGRDLPRRIVLTVGAAYLVGHLFSVAGVLEKEKSGVLAGDPRWILLPDPVLWGLVGVGTLCVFAASLTQSRLPAGSADGGHAHGVGAASARPVG